MFDFRRNNVENDQTPVWHIFSEHIHSMRLFKSSEDEFRTIEQGAMVPIFYSPLFVIVNEVLVRFFEEHVGEQVSFHPVTIYDRPTKSYIPGYHRIYIKEVFDIHDGWPADHIGKKIWLYPASRFIFISLSLKKAMEAATVKGVFYSPGFSFIG